MLKTFFLLPIPAFILIDGTFQIHFFKFRHSEKNDFLILKNYFMSELLSKKPLNTLLKLLVVIALI